MKAMLLAAGKGTRLAGLNQERPKVLFPVCGRPILEHNLLYLKSYGIRQVAVNLHAQADVVCDFLRAKRFPGMEILFSHETNLLGTAGAVRQMAPFFQGSDFLVLYGDNLVDFDLKDFLKKHKEGRALMTLGVFQPQKTASSGIAAGLIQCRKDGSIESFQERRGNRNVPSGAWANAGAMMCSPKILKEIPSGRPYDFSKDLYPKLLKKKMILKTYAGASYVLASDTPESWRRTCRLAKNRM